MIPTDMTPESRSTDGGTEVPSKEADERSRVHVSIYASAAIGLTAALWLGGGLGGVGLAIVVIALWIAIPTAYAFAVGQLLYVVLLAEADIAGVVGAAALGVLFVVDLAERWPPRVALLATVTFAIAAGAFIAGWAIADPIRGATLIAIGFAVISYAMYRYGLVRLGIVTEQASDST
jgi:hypothetical protein